MSRPKPLVLIEHLDKRTYKLDQVLEAEAIWAVFYKDRPFNLKTSNSITNYPGPKYKKVSFSNQGYAINLAKRLNKVFNTSDFSVVKMTKGEKIYP